MGPVHTCPLQLRSDSDGSEVPAPFTSSGHFSLRWFTPTTEVPLCGHATLAAAAVLFKGACSSSSLASLYHHSPFLPSANFHYPCLQL